MKDKNNISPKKTPSPGVDEIVENNSISGQVAFDIAEFTVGDSPPGQKAFDISDLMESNPVNNSHTG